jgi:nucleoid DNA-binding protein
MTKAGLIHGIAARIYLPAETVKLVLTALADELAEVLVAEGVASVHGIGRLRVARQVRKVESSLTGAVGEHRYVTLRASRSFKRRLGAGRRTRHPRRR